MKRHFICITYIAGAPPSTAWSADMSVIYYAKVEESALKICDYWHVDKS